MLSCRRPKLICFYRNATAVCLMLTVLALLQLKSSDGFVLVPSINHRISLQQQIPAGVPYQMSNGICRNEEPRKRAPFQKIWKRFDTLETAGLKDITLTSGWSERFNAIHSPKTYLGLAALSLFKFKGLYRNYLFWIGIAFLVKWYRARYVFKIPVWDRQPNWNNVITSKEQEKDLKAFTCKNCGSTIFIAKSREFFFEGGTGLAGLGCFTCGVKGKENFTMDRDRIVEDVGDMDDYFEYERPLDFVSAAEKKKLMREAGGDEEKANQILLDRAAAEPGSVEETEASASVTAPPPPTAESPPKEEKPSPPKSTANEANLDDLGMDDF